jgi:lipopolysaccharide export system protein LptC
MTEVRTDTAWPESDRSDAGGRETGRPRERLVEVMDLGHSPRRGAFGAAGRHSARVRILRRAMIAGSIIAVAGVAIFATFDPFRRLPGNISIGQVKVEGTRITVESPKITGLQKNGRPYEVTARAGMQDTTIPNIVELLDIDAKIGLSDASTLQVTAARGMYDSSNDHLALDGSTRIMNNVGYTIFMKTAQINFKTGALISKDPVNVLLQGGRIAANHLDIENDDKVSFEGDVRSTIEPGASENAPSE